MCPSRQNWLSVPHTPIRSVLISIQEKKIQFSQKLDKVKDKGKEWIGKVKETKEKGNEMMNRWEEKSKEFIGSFVELFGKQGKIVSIIKLLKILTAFK